MCALFESQKSKEAKSEEPTMMKIEIYKAFWEIRQLLSSCGSPPVKVTSRLCSGEGLAQGGRLLQLRVVKVRTRLFGWLRGLESV